MTIITVKGHAVFVGQTCVEREARTRDEAYDIAVSVEASLNAANVPCEIKFQSETA